MTVPHMDSISINTVTARERSSAIATLVTAFSADPVVRWLYPEPEQYLTHFPEFIQRFAGRAFDHGTAYYAGDFAGAALWLAPSVQPDEEALVEYIEASVAERDQEAVFEVLEQMDRYHPQEPVWYLPLVGVDPHRQSRGYGSALLQHALLKCDEEHLPAYLESSNERNIPLYERHGFQVIGTIQAEGSPPLWPMLRGGR
jgi:ribosomal protein S18 acetylase RimI-like enzyme